MGLGEVVRDEVVDRELEDEDGNGRFPEAVTEKDAGDGISGGEEAGEQNCAGEARGRFDAEVDGVNDEAEAGEDEEAGGEEDDDGRR